MPRKPAGRIDWVDYAKGLCIVMVVLMHTTLGVEKAGGAPSWLDAAIEFARPFRMPDFFLISGLFLSRVIDRDWRTYLDRKVVHFVYFYVLWVTIQWAMKAIYPAYVSGDLAGAGMGLVSALWDPPGALWFIYMLPIYFVLAKLVRPLPPALVLGAGALINILPHNYSWFVADEFSERLVFFLIGTYAARYVFAFAAWADARPVGAFGLLCLWALINGTLVQLNVAHLPVIGLLLGLVGAGAVITTGVLLSRFAWADWLRLAGQHSLVVYLAFFVPMAALRTLAFAFVPSIDSAVLSLAITAASVAVPLLGFFAVRDTPLRFLFRRPDWARIAPPKAAAQPRMVPAE